MAKISANGCTALAKVEATYPATGMVSLWVLRSDGKLLRRHTGELGTGYKIAGKLKKGVELNEETLRRIVTRLGYEING